MNLINKTALAAAVLMAAACTSGGIPPAVEPEKPEVEDDKKFELPEGPYIYDDGFSNDAQAFLEAYKGETFNGPHQVPGSIEAEDFDDGPSMYAYFESDTKDGDASYRGAHKVDIRRDANASGGYMIGDVQPGEWMSYTIEVQQDGVYAIDTYICKGDGSEGSFSFEVDGWGATRPVAMPLNGWSDFSMAATADGVSLTAGRHVLRYCAATPGNVDRFVFRRTGDLQEGGSSISYPIVKTMSNPLFVDFPSPMYRSSLTGHFYSADASARVWNIDGKEVLYVYASHDMEPSVGCDRMDRYHVFSTEDMKTWTDHGEILNAATVRLHDGWGSDGFMWAPDCAYNPQDGLYYFYFPHPENNASWNSTWRTGVAVSRFPDKEFYVVGYVKGMPAAIDPCVFVDDDGQPYIYNGGGGKCYGAKLRKGDWTRLETDPVPMTGLEDFHEATWVHKFNGKYYLSHSDNHSPSQGGNMMRYAVSDSPLGPWESLGVYMYPQGLETNHGSIVKFRGNWYAFYHTADFSGNGTLRSVCVNQIKINADGTIDPVRNWGTAPGGISPVLKKGETLVVEAEKYNDGGRYSSWFTRSGKQPGISDGLVRDLEAGDWLRYSFNSETAGTCRITLRLEGTPGSRVHVSLNGIHPSGDGLSAAGSSVEAVGLEVPRGESYIEIRVASGKISADRFELVME